MMSVRRVLAVVLPTAAACALLPSVASADMFLRIDGVPGSSQVEGFQNAIDIDAYSWGASHAAPASRTAKPSPPTFSDFNFSKNVDKSSPLLLQHLGAGDVISAAKLSVTRAGGVAGPTEYLSYCLRDVRVTSLSQGGSSGSGTPEESFSLSYGSVLESYAPQSSTGALLPRVFAGWDLLNNLALTNDDVCAPADR